MDQKVRKTCDDFQFHLLFNELHNFCAMDLSAFYLDIRKDSLYCDRIDSTRRRASRTVLNKLFNCLTKWFAPFICFTAEEVWQTRYPNADSVHLQLFPDIPDDWRDDCLAEKWAKIRSVRRVVTGALEIERSEKRIGSSLQARPVIYTTKENCALFTDLDAGELFITSGADFSTNAAPESAFTMAGIEDIAVVPTLSKSDKCPRCYQFPNDIGVDPTHPEVCGRCADAYNHHTHAAA
jgi:isoleucyl-tRNA synthetase